MIIAIDGHSACGKSTLAKDLARHLHFIYIDSGAMYRSVALYFLEHKINISIQSNIESHLNRISIDFVPGDNPKVFLNKKDVTESIRSFEVSECVSAIAEVSEVRKRMVQLQRKISKDKSVVMDGRDIGSIVFPHAEVKIFLTADLQTRAMRRHKELASKGIQTDLLLIKNNLIKRDYIDSNRADSPLIKSPDAFVIDNSNLTREEQTKIALDLIRQAMAK